MIAAERIKMPEEVQFLLRMNYYEFSSFRFLSNGSNYPIPNQMRTFRLFANNSEQTSYHVHEPLTQELVNSKSEFHEHLKRQVPH